MIYPTAYDTTAGKGFIKTKIIRAIQESAIRDGASDRSFGLIKYSDQNNAVTNEGASPLIPWCIVGSMSSEAQIPFFAHPLVVELQEKDQKVICVDIRPFASYNINHINDDDAIRVKNKIGLNLERLRLSLNIIWLQERPTMLRDMSFIPMAIFSNWISESITRRFGLSPRDEVVLGVVCCYYYYSLFTNNVDFDDNERNRLIASIMKIVRIPSTFVEEVFNKVQPMYSIKDFAKTIREIVDTTRLDNFDEGVLINLVISSWFGVEARQLVSVAMEHPPTWISLVYTAFTEKSYKNTVISKTAQRYLGPKGENDFVRSLVTLISED